LYRDKDYAGEAKFIHDLIMDYAPKTRSILELGCGTGAHAAKLADFGYVLHGVDLSHQMLEFAAKRLSGLNRDLADKLSFSHGDIRTVRLSKKFDAIISLFHVMSYQTTNEDLLASFSTAKLHLNPGGIFIFDCWYGPAVISGKPEVRVKRLEDEQIQVTRIAEPIMHVVKNIVDVNYHVFIKFKANNTIAELREVHTMRYLFGPEVELLLAQQKMKLLTCFELLSRREASVDTWGVCFVVRA
jgi:SAM-dependent methyltransferase